MSKQSTDLALSDFDFSGESGAGFENVTSDSFAVPFIYLAQPLSPFCVAGNAAYNEDVKAGQFYDPLLKTPHKTLRLVQCAYDSVYIRKSGGASGKFRGIVEPAEVAKLTKSNKLIHFEGKVYFTDEKGEFSEKTSDRLVDTRNHYCLMLGEDGAYQRVIVSLSSTQIKGSRGLMSLLMQQRENNAVLPSYATVIAAKSVPTSNDRGNWFLWDFSLVGRVQTVCGDNALDIIVAAREFNKIVTAGKVDVKYDAAEDAEGEDFETETKF